MTLRAILAGMALLGASSLHHPSGSLPLARGVYVDVDTPCRRAPMSARSWFGGGYVIQASHARCASARVTRKDSKRYMVVSNCHADEAKSSYRVVERITVISSTEFQLENQFGHFHARWCRE